MTGAGPTTSSCGGIATMTEPTSIVESPGGLKRLPLRLAVVQKLFRWRILRIPNGHYYSPVPSMRQVRRDRARIFDRSRDDIPGIDLHADEQLALLKQLAVFFADQPFPDTRKGGIRYFFNNEWFGRADAIFLYSMIRQFRPRRIIEIGSGFSSAVMLDTNERFFDRTIRLTYIEPNSARLRKLLRPEDYATVTVIEKPIQRVDPTAVQKLQTNDMLFIDSSHVSKVGSDVNHIVFELLPRLAPGVVVHFHDVLFPFEYRQDWLELGVYWNEPYLLRAFLQYNATFRIRLWNDYLTTFHADAIRAVMPRCTERLRGVGGSLWLQKMAS